MPFLWEAFREEVLREWQQGEPGRISQEETLLPTMPLEDYDSRRGENQGDIKETRQEIYRDGFLFPVRFSDETPHPPQGRKSKEQRRKQSVGPLPSLPHEDSQREKEVHGMRVARSCATLLREALPKIQEAWRSFSEVLRERESREGSDLIHCAVGGGKIGSRLSHLNEAPYPEDLCERFIRCFCPPNGIVCDPMAGSGTTLSVAIQWGRRAIGCDLRPSQKELTSRRMAETLAKLPLSESSKT